MINVSVIGAGVLGEALIERLLNCGFSVSAYNRTKHKLEKLILKGVRPIESLDKAFVCEQKIWILCLRDEKSIREVFSCEKIIEALKLNKFLIINTSTIGPKGSAKLEGFFKEFNVEYIELPVSGGIEGALSGQLVGYIGNYPKYLRREFDFVLRALLKGHCLMQSNQAAQAMKVVNNYCESINLVVAAEALLLAETYGISKEVIGGSLGLGRGRSVYLELLLERYMSMKCCISVPLEIRIKDLELAGELFHELSIKSRFYDDALELYKKTLCSSSLALDQMDCFAFLSSSVKRGAR
ncbi:NAD(P)-dependent oxidoreductase [Pseudomonas fluorescens]|uniref:2-hydroxy-3-oxopropionate reductase n=1 Tax=Pseudomonas fluorescens TaxID=294 RepID=A0A5E7DLF5_PSEFL|nr:NAD(P)-binding domain-containing protein [Pseudomonas fluorescens]VVO18400.1 2-hydroxy-3-oxopropionate reductase [Pseudomonas fluorescens]